MDLNKLPYYPNILLISGNGRNVGKTTLSCALIEHFKSEKIIAVKISPHTHEFDANVEDVLFQTKDIIIIEEHRKDTGKDSAKFLKAGANRVFFIMVNDSYLQQAFDKLMEFVDEKSPMIIESAALRKIIIPGQFLLLNHVDRPAPKKSIVHLMDFVDRRITLFHNYHDFAPTDISYTSGEWLLNS